MFLGEELDAEWCPHSIRTEILLIHLLEPKLDVHLQSKSQPVYEQTQCSDAIYIYIYFINNSSIFLLYTFNDPIFLQIHVN